MAGSDDNRDDEKVGYGKPPKHTRWKKGQSGNPSGKTSKEASLRVTLQKIAAKEIVVQENGTAVSMSRDEAMLLATMTKAMRGDLPAVRLVVDLLGIEPEISNAPPEFEVTEADLAVLETHADWMRVLETGRAERRQNQQDETEPGDDENDDTADDF